jgi:AcrR family transcriptional regulator
MSEEVRARIVEAAVRLLETKGAKGFGQVKVAREAGLQQGHLTYYFPKKSDLVVAVLERLSSRARAEMQRVLARSAELDPEASEELLYELARTLLRDRGRSRILVGLLAEAVDDPEVAAALAAQNQYQRAVIALLLRREADDPDVQLIAAAMRGVGIENLLEPDDDARVDAVIARFRTWFRRRPQG